MHPQENMPTFRSLPAGHRNQTITFTHKAKLHTLCFSFLATDAYELHTRGLKMYHVYCVKNLKYYAMTLN